jgi:hypothetical protein
VPRKSGIEKSTYRFLTLRALAIAG